MKLNDLRRRIAAAIDPDTVKKPSNDGFILPQLDPLEAPPITPTPGGAVPLNDDQRANLEALRDRYAPDRQHKRAAGVDNPLQRAAANAGISLEMIRRVSGQNASSGLDRMRDEKHD